MNESNILISIIKHLLNNTMINEAYNDYDFNNLLKLAKGHSLENMLYYGYINKIINLTNDQIHLLSKINKNALYKSITFDLELELITKTFEDNKIKHMFLKGSVLKKYYPSIDMRSMADVDVLVLKNDLKKIKTLMKEIGYVPHSIGGNHDVYYKLPIMNIEVHRQMIDDSYKLSKYYLNIWDKVSVIDEKSYSYKQSDDDFYIYLVTHAAKHFSNGGTGIRSIMDIYVFLKAKTNLNFNYIDEEFKKIGILTLANKLKQLAYIWFGNDEMTEDYQILANYIISSGTYGIMMNSIILNELNDEVKSLNKSKIILKRAFPDFKTMKKIFPSLKYLPFLLPFYYLIRIIKAIFSKKSHVSEQFNSITSINENDVRRIKKVKEIVDLNNQDN